MATLNAQIGGGNGADGMTFVLLNPADSSPEGSSLSWTSTSTPDPPAARQLTRPDLAGRLSSALFARFGAKVEHIPLLEPRQRAPCRTLDPVPACSS